MTKHVFILFALLAGQWSFAKSVDERHFLLTGKVLEIDPVASTEKPASGVQVVVYQEGKVYVAFKTGKSGTYEFNLPVGHSYELWYGGNEYVNKRVVIDASTCPARKTGNDFRLDIGLFKPIEGYEFSILSEPYVMIGYDREMQRLVPNMEYSEEKARALNKVFRKILRDKDASYCEEAYYK